MPSIFKHGSPNKMSCELKKGGKWWLSDVKHPNYEAAARAIKKLYGVEPDFTREGVTCLTKIGGSNPNECNAVTCWGM